MREDIKLKPFDQAKHEAGFQAIADEVDTRVLERIAEISKERSTQDPGLISTSDNTTEWTTEVRDGITVHQSKPKKDI